MYNTEKYNGWEDAEWREFWGVDEYDAYDPFEGEEELETEEEAR